MSQKPTWHAQGESPGLGPTASVPGPWPLDEIEQARPLAAALDQPPFFLLFSFIYFF
jgi:hypothetical protein